VAGAAEALDFHKRALGAEERCRMSGPGGKVADPFGHDWSISTHIEDVAPEEMERRSREFAEKMAKGEC
jgi:uncharacterized glyoxalase superfamily protein PhnB